MDKSQIEDIQNVIGYSFSDGRLLEQAFTRSSFTKEHPECLDNEVLEFYGDEALDYFVTQNMYGQYSGFTKDGQFKSQKTEQELTEMKSRNVDTAMLSHCIKITGLQRYLCMNKSDTNNNVQNSPSVMADLFEAIVGAVAVDSDWDFDVISEVCSNLLINNSCDINYIEWLYKWCSDKGYAEPCYVEKVISGRTILGISHTTAPNYTREPDRLEGVVLEIKELKLRIKSELTQAYSAYMECARKAYDIIKIREMNDVVGEPEYDDAINQLNVLYQKNFIEEPEYRYEENHDEDGNPVWHCECDLDELEDVFYGESSVKKEAKKEAAYGALCELFGNGETDDDF